MRSFFGLVFLAGLGINLALLRPALDLVRPASSAVPRRSRGLQGWHAQQISNRWVQLMVVPQNGGRLMQVVFAGHSYLFVNPKYEGKYLPPSSGEWFNYGGDKIWLLPEGNDDEQHWAGGSDVIDDGPFSFRKVSEGNSVKSNLRAQPIRAPGFSSCAQSGWKPIRRESTFTPP